MIHPSGRKLCESYQNFDEEGFPRSQLHPSLGGRPWLGECLFWFVFSAPEKMNEIIQSA